MVSFTLWAATLAVACSGAQAFPARETGQTLAVDGISYYAQPEPVSTLPGFRGLFSVSGRDDNLLPLTVIVDKQDHFSWAVYVVHEGPSIPSMDVPGKDLLLKHKIEQFAASKHYLKSSPHGSLNVSDCTQPLSSGPYFISPSTGEVYEAYRLYSDVQGAFTEGIVAADDNTYSILEASIPGVQSLTIGVPSRLYFTKTAEKPLAGVRFGIKDIYDIAGVKTSCCNRAYYELYPKKNTTAPSIQRLIDAGAVIVGKMKTSQFANSEAATADWVDYHAPFNPRGDGYQDPSSSSAGPGAGCGAYDWLDITVGSDTGGSIRNPAQVNGCFGNRPTHDLVSLDSVMPMSPALDTPGFLTRDPYLWHEAAKVMYETNITDDFKAFPKRLYTISFPETPSSEAEEILVDFANKVQSFLKGNLTKFNISSVWAANPPTAANNASLTDYLGDTYAVLISQQQHKLVTVPFFEDYAAAFDGRQPAVDPAAKIRWDWGQKNISSSALDDHLHRKAVFVDWWKKHGNRPDQDTCSDSILLYPGSLGDTNYRNQYRGPPGIPTGWGDARVSNIGSVPDLVVPSKPCPSASSSSHDGFPFMFSNHFDDPIGQTAYNSSVTNHEEYLPVAIDFVAAAGCDGMLFELVKQLTDAGIVTPPKAGRVLY
ncbi:hypothetical protein KEM56_003431 [Ascosphaera pollenicola]|nr:hypothetical protein KEM56_003431 [Ascosphaera pollenicola]